MRYLNKIIFLNSAHIPYAEIKLDGNVHFIGTQGVGKSTLLRAILFFYNAYKLKLGIPKEKKNFDAFYFPYANSYIVYEVMRENGAYSLLAAKSMGRVFFRFIDAPYSRAWFMDERGEVFPDWSRIRERISTDHHPISAQVTSYEMYRDIIFGNNRKQEMIPYRKFAIVESTKYQNIPRAIQNVFMNSKLDADFIKDTTIRSMSEENLFIDLDYFRSQIKEFEQEYKDVSCWFTKNKSGEITVHKQAEQVMNSYRHLVYIKKQIKEGREELNFAEKTAREKLPVLQKEIAQTKEKYERATRLIGEEQEKYQKERERLIGQKGGVDTELKRIKEKQQYYTQVRIEEVSRRVAEEDNLQQEQAQLARRVADLTHTYEDILAKYRNLADGLQTEWQTFLNRQNASLLEKKEKAAARQEGLLTELRKQEEFIRDSFEEHMQRLQNTLIQLHRQQSEHKQQQLKLSYAHPYQKEINDYQESLSELEKKDQELDLQIRRLKIDAEQWRQTGVRESEKLEWSVRQESEALRSQRTTLETRLHTLAQFLENQKGSFCEWLEQHKPDWKETVGKVIDEEQILYNQQLNPQLTAPENETLFGIRLDLSGVERSIRCPETIKQEQAQLQQKWEELRRQGIQLTDQLAESLKKLETKYKQRIREKTDEQHTLEAERQQLPFQAKNLKADLATWQRKEETWRQQEKDKIEKRQNDTYLALKQTEEELSRLQTDKEKQLKAARKSYEEAKKTLQATVDQTEKRLSDETQQKRQACETQKTRLHRLQLAELSGKGVDTTVIAAYEQKIDAIGKELEYIRLHRSIVSDYEKDRRELFDREPELRNLKKEIENRLADLQEKYERRKERWAAQQKDIRQELDEAAKELDTLTDELDKMAVFRKDATFCPPETQTKAERPTRKSCAHHIETLKSLIVATLEKIVQFKKTVNLFKSNFTTKNTFNFPTELTDDDDYFGFAANLCEFIDNDKIAEFQQRISERYTDIIRRISKETGDLTQHESEINKTIQAINSDFITRNFAGVIKQIALRSQPSNDKLMQLLLEIKRFNEENQFNMGAIDLFSQASRTEVNQKAVRYLHSFMHYLLEDPGRKQVLLSDTFKLEFRVMENDNDTGWVEKIANVGSDGTDILVKAMVNIMLINVFKEKASRKFGEFKIHCMMDEIGKLHPTNVKGILEFANCRNILLINSSPTTYNVEDYRYTYLLRKDSRADTQVIPLLTHNTLNAR